MLLRLNCVCIVTQKMKKVLVITYYWPPAGGPGVQRILKFVKYLPKFGYQPVVLTVRDGTFPAIDTSLLKEIPTDVKVYKCKTIEPFGLYKKALGKDKDWKIPTHVHEEKKSTFMNQLSKWIRANLFIPDARIGWRFFAVREAIRIVETENIDMIFSTSPPQSLQLIAKSIARKTDKPWLADFRDPWTDLFTLKELPRNNFVKWIDQYLEKTVLSNADVVSTVSQGLIDLFVSKTSKPKYIELPNGYDISDFKGIEKQPVDKFRIVYLGYIDKSQVPYSFLKTLSELPDEILGEMDVQFYGKCHPAMHSEAERLGIQNRITFNGYVPHNKVVQLMKNAVILLLIIPDVENNAGILTGKLFEYLATQNYILGIGPEQGDAARILQTTNSGQLFDYKKDISNHIIELFNKWKRQEPLSEINRTMVENYSREKLTQKLASEFDELLDG